MLIKIPVINRIIPPILDIKLITDYKFSLDTAWRDYPEELKKLLINYSIGDLLKKLEMILKLLKN